MSLAIPKDIHALVVRLVTPAGAIFPVQEYYTPAKEWSADRKDARGFPWEVADHIARKLTSPELHVYPVILSSDEAKLMAGKDQPPRTDRTGMTELSIHDWHEGKPNCGVE